MLEKYLIGKENFEDRKIYLIMCFVVCCIIVLKIREWKIVKVFNRYIF